jgi:hypothetical protein
MSAKGRMAPSLMGPWADADGTAEKTETKIAMQRILKIETEILGIVYFFIVLFLLSFSRKIVR